MRLDTSPAAASHWSRRTRVATLLALLLAAPAAAGTVEPPVYIWCDAGGGIRFTTVAAPAPQR